MRERSHLGPDPRAASRKPKKGVLISSEAPSSKNRFSVGAAKAVHARRAKTENETMLRRKMQEANVAVEMFDRCEMTRQVCNGFVTLVELCCADHQSQCSRAAK